MNREPGVTSPERTPDVWVVAPEEVVLSGFVIPVGMPNAAIFHEDAATGGALALGMGVRGEGTGPGDVAMAGGVESVAAFGEDPTGAGVNFAEGEVVRGDVLVRAGK